VDWINLATDRDKLPRDVIYSKLESAVAVLEALSLHVSGIEDRMIIVEK
jgi:hypothetical protein